MSDTAPERATLPIVAEPARPLWPDFAPAQAWPEAAPARIALSHRRDGTRVHVRVDPASLARYRELSTDAGMQDGARVMAFHESPTGALLGGYLLEKHGTSWSALEIDGQGAVVPGDRAPCLRCHDMAPTDHLFGLGGRPAQPPDPGESTSFGPR